MTDKVIVLLVFLAAGVIAYLLGSINFAIIYTRAFANIDVRDVGSGNAGMTNAFRAGGKYSGILTFVCDFAKTIAAVAIGRYAVFALLNYLPQTQQIASTIDPVYGAFICGVCCLLGHLYPLYFGFRGGKGVVTSAAMVLLIDWRVFLIIIAVFLICFAISRIVSLSSIAAAVALPIVTYFIYDFTHAASTYTYSPFNMGQKNFEALFALIIAAIVIIKHRENIKRILKGEEKKMSFKKKN
ncbi:MAG TPA: glycerol-3-phosphate 1-O-acyltransferase PlsY [Firmicutes bacterium]|nr:glycerol-3-phosphate 1-O-acyltransferase PlsY [Bacillota bacterium]